MLQAHIIDHFKNLLEYQNWVKKHFANLSSANQMRSEYFDSININNMIKRKPDWFGNDTTFEELESGITEYQSPELIEEMYNKIEGKISTGIKNRIKAKKMKYNSSGLGTFVFDRAAMGMYKLKEFYSSKHSRVVDEREVKQVKKGYELIKDGSAVIERWEEKPDGSQKIRTTTKDVYAFFPKMNKEKHAVELFISCGGHVGIKADQFLYSGISAIIVAQLLEKAKIQTKISIVIGSSPDSFVETAYGCIIPVKNYDERLDRNLLALLTSDPRFFRYEGFKGIVSLYDHHNEVTPNSFGQGMNKDFLIKTIENSSYTKSTKIAPNRFYFGWTFSESNALENINETIEEIANRFE